MKQLTAAEISAIAGVAPTTGVQMTNLVGDPTKPGLYTVRVAIAAGTQVEPHMHRDNRSVTVMSGNWQMAYGEQVRREAAQVAAARQRVHRAFGPAALFAVPWTGRWSSSSRAMGLAIRSSWEVGARIVPLPLAVPSRCNILLFWVQAGQLGRSCGQNSTPVFILCTLSRAVAARTGIPLPGSTQNRTRP